MRVIRLPLTIAGDREFDRQLTEAGTGLNRLSRTPQR